MGRRKLPQRLCTGDAARSSGNAQAWTESTGQREAFRGVKSRCKLSIVRPELDAVRQGPGDWELASLGAKMRGQ